MSAFARAVALLDRQPSDALTRCPVLVGLDGFVDTILHVGPSARPRAITPA